MSEADALRRQALEEATRLVANMAHRLAQVEVAYETLAREQTALQQEVAALRAERAQLRASLRFFEEQHNQATLALVHMLERRRRWWRVWRSS